MSGTPTRRPSLAAVSPAVSGRRLSSGITPNVATPSVDNNNAESRRGSLRDLPNERDAFGAALRQYDRDLKSGKHSHCTYPAIRQRLISTQSDVLPPTIAKDKSIITLDGSTDPVEAFDSLIESGLEAIPVTVSQHHSHNTDGTITLHSSHQQFPALYKLAKENKEKATIAAAQSQQSQQSQQHLSQPSTPGGQNDSPTVSPSPSPSTPISPKPLGLGGFTTPAKSSIHDQVIVIDPVTLIPTFQPASSTTSLLPSTSSNTSATTVTSPGNPSSATPVRSLRESLNLQPQSQGPVHGCTSDCPFRQAAGWLDIRDLASCIVYVYQQPVNEDLLEFREGGGLGQQPLIINTRGLDGITDLPGLTKSSSFSSLHSTDEESVTPLSNTSSLHPSLPEEPSNIDSMAIVYEDDQAKAQGLVLKATYQQQTRSQGGFSHRLSLAPMMEEEDTFDLGSIKAPDTPVTPSTPSSSNYNNVSTTAPLSESGSKEDISSRSRSQSRHRRKMVSADELGSEFTEGGQQAWLNTLKHGLGKFSAVGNISTAYLSRRHPLRSVKSSASLYDIFKLLSANHAHRVVVVDDKSGKMIDIVSHRTIIQYLWSHRDEFFALSSSEHQDDSTITDGDETSEVESSLTVATKSLLDKQIDDLNIGTRNLVQIRNDILGLDALQEMDEHSRTGLAVVDDCGRLIGATSARTIKKITHNRDHKTMSLPLLTFIEQNDEDLEQSEDADEGCMVSHGAVVLLDDEVTFQDVLSAMYKHNTNRVFLVDEESYPTKVISLSDILQLILY